MPDISRYYIEKLRKEERRRQRLANGEEVEAIDDCEIVSKASHLTNIEASDQLLALLLKHHPNGPGLPVITRKS